MKFLKIALALALGKFFLISCSDNSEDLTGCLEVLPPVYLSFNVLSAESERDVFFSTPPEYELKDLYFFRSRDTNRSDTIRPKVEGSGEERFFRIEVDNTGRSDTLSMNIGANSQDRLTVTIKNTDDVCPVPTIDKIHFNNTELIPENGKVKIRK